MAPHRNNRQRAAKPTACIALLTTFVFVILYFDLQNIAGAGISLRLQQSKAKPDTEVVGQIRAEAEKAKDDAKEAKAEAERAKVEAKEAKAEAEKAKDGAEEAKAEAEKAKAEAERAKAGVRTDEPKVLNTHDQRSIFATNTTVVPFYIPIHYRAGGGLHKIITIVQHRLPQFYFYEVEDAYQAKLVMFRGPGDLWFKSGIDYHSVAQNAILVQWSAERTYPARIFPADVGSGHPFGPASKPGAVMEYFRLPYGIVTNFNQETCWWEEEDERLMKQEGTVAVEKWRERKYDVTVFWGHLVYPREEMFKWAELLFGNVTSGGKALHTIPEPAPVNKKTYARDGRFILCPENEYHEGYVTEKLYHAFMLGAIPIYWPIPDPEHHLFNPKRIICFDPENPDVAKNKIQDLMTNETALLEFFNEPILVEGAKSYTQSLCNDFADGVGRHLESLSVEPDFSGSPYHCKNKLLNSEALEGQDIFMFDHAFRGMCHGTFVELGGADGIANSNTFAAETDMGWRGVLIEANPISYQVLARRRDRNNSIKVFGAVGNEGKNATFIQIDQPQLQMSVMKEFASKEQLNQLESLRKASNGKGIKEVSVPMKPLTTWLDMYDLKQINWLCLDVEGTELSVLQTLEFTKIKVDFFQIRKIGKDEELLQILEPHGYQLYKPWMEANPGELDMILCHQSVCPAPISAV